MPEVGLEPTRGCSDLAALRRCETASSEDSRATMVDTCELTMPKSEVDRFNIIATRYSSPGSSLRPWLI
jgi:hypothetical protein